MNRRRKAFFNPLLEDETIETFGDTPGYTHTVDDIEEAEEEIQEDEEERADDKSEEELEEMDTEEVMRLRFTPRFDYGTPAGGGGCSTCGTEDAGDVAIIDAEISPVEGDDTESDLGSPVAEETPAEDDNIMEEMRALNSLYQKQELRSTFLGVEGFFGDLIDGLVGIFKTVTIKVAKYARRTYLFSRKAISSTFLRMETVHKLWKFKIERNLSDVDLDRLQKYELEAFPLEVWSNAARCALNAYDMVRAAERIVFDAADDAVTNGMKNFNKQLNDNGIELNLSKNRIDYDKLMDHRLYQSVLDLGYTKSHMPNIMRYFGEMSKRVKNAKDNDLQQITDNIIKKVSSGAARLNEMVEEGQLKKGSEKYKEEVERLMHQTVRLDFVLSCMRCAYHLFDLLTADALKIFSKYEDAMDIASIVD